MKLYNFELSGNCYKVRLFLSMLDLEYEIIPIDILKKEQKSASYLKINPMGELPALEDRGLILRDSQAILVYLAREYSGEEWLPGNSDSMGRVMQWLSTASNEIARGLADSRYYTKLKIDLDIETAHKKSKAILDFIDHHLADKNWLELDRVTIADIACFPYIALSHEGDVSLKPYANVRRWIDRIKKLPGFISMPGIEALE